jgi:hypothetical protein
LWLGIYKGAADGEARAKVMRDADADIRAHGLSSLFSRGCETIDASTPSRAPSTPAPARELAPSRAVHTTADFIEFKPFREYPAPVIADPIDEWMHRYRKSLTGAERDRCIIDAHDALGPLWVSFIKRIHAIDYQSYNPAELEWYDMQSRGAPPPHWDLEPEHPLKGQVPRLRDAWVQDEESLLAAHERPPPGMVSSEAQTRVSGLTYGPEERDRGETFKPTIPPPPAAPVKEDKWGPTKERFRTFLNNYTNEMRYITGKRNEIRNMMPDLFSDSYSEYSSDSGTQELLKDPRARQAYEAGLRHIHDSRYLKRRRHW